MTGHSRAVDDDLADRSVERRAVIEDTYDGPQHRASSPGRALAALRRQADHLNGHDRPLA
jgi:hypothetical protein